MKNTFIIAATFVFAMGAASLTWAAPATETVALKDGFMKKKDGTWAGKMDNKMYWYKLDANAKLWWSTDGKTWAAVANQMWADKDGKWLKINEKKLVWSADMGKTWSEVPEWKWQGPDGEWYKFDAEWSLWVNK